MVEKITWHDERRKLSDLIPWPRNPRQIQKDGGWLISGVHMTQGVPSRSRA